LASYFIVETCLMHRCLLSTDDLPIGYGREAVTAARRNDAPAASNICGIGAMGMMCILRALSAALLVAALLCPAAAQEKPAPREAPLAGKTLTSRLGW
jgi:hypothetical protein